MPSKKIPTIKAIIPTLSNTDGLRGLLDDLARQSIVSKIVVVDNAPTIEKKSLSKKYAHLTYLPQENNLGFAAAVNLASVSGRKTDYLLIANDDIRIPDQNLIKKLMIFLKQEKLSAAVPLLINPTGLIENIGYFMLPKGKVQLNFNPKIHFARGSDIFSPKDLGGITAAFLLIKTDTFQSLGGFDESFFAYLEDIDLSLKMKKRGFHFGVATDLQVCHQHQATSKNMGAFKEKQDVKNWYRLIWKHWSTSQKIKYFWPLFVERLHNLNGLLKKYLRQNRVVDKMSTLFSYSIIVTKKAVKNLRHPIVFAQKLKRWNREDLKLEIKYQQWIKEVETPNKAAKIFPKFKYQPKISVLVPVYNVHDEHLQACIESVIQQSYPNWELCLVDDASTWSSVKAQLKKYQKHPQIKIKYRPKNGHISRCTNDALALSTGEYIALLDCDDTLEPDALAYVVEKLNANPKIDWLYTDEDKIDADGGNRHAPHFKPDWSPDTLMSHMYTCHLSVYRKKLVTKVGGMRVGFEGSQDYDLALRLAEIIPPPNITHIPHILYHWREHPGSTAGSGDAKPYVYEAAKKAKIQALTRRKQAGKLHFIEEINQFQVEYEVQGNPLVSIIIPSKDNFDYLRKCIQSLVTLTAYKNYEIIVVDNGSTKNNQRKYQKLINDIGGCYLYQKMPFNFSQMCNLGAKNAQGEYLLFLNDDIEIIQADWLTQMLGFAQQKHIGAVGAKLLYPDKKIIQACGVGINFAGPTNILTHQKDNHPIRYFSRNRLSYNTIAITGACLLLSAQKFTKMCGFDEKFPVAYNDVDLGIRLYKSRYFNVNLGNIVLVHHESISRGIDTQDPKKMRRLLHELRQLENEHPEFTKYDPFYQSHLDQITLFNEQSIGTNQTKH